MLQGDMTHNVYQLACYLTEYMWQWYGLVVGILARSIVLSCVKSLSFSELLRWPDLTKSQGPRHNLRSLSHALIDP